MSTNIRDTSLDAYDSIKPEIKTRQREVYDAIKYLKSPTNTEISKFLGIPINSITPRTNELYKKKLVVDGKKRECYETGRIAYTWRIVGDA